MSSAPDLPSLKIFNELYLYEYWLLTELKPILNNFSELNLQDKESFLENLTLYYTFNIRRHIDPLFSAKIYSLILKDNEFLQNINFLIKSLLESTFNDKKEFKLILDKSDVFNSILKNDQESLVALEFYSHPESLVTIYRNMQKLALEEGNLEILEVVNLFLGIIEKTIYAIKDIDETENSYGTIYPLGKEMLNLKRFLITNIKNLKQYTSTIPSNHIILMDLCAFSFINLIENEINKFTNDKEFLSTPIYFNKVIGNFLSIICSTWFIKKDLNEKITLLNVPCSTSIWLENLREEVLFLNSNSLQIWNLYLNDLASLGCFREVSDIVDFIIENIHTLKPIEKTFFLDHLAYANIQLGEYLTALKYLDNEKNLILTSQTAVFKKNVFLSILKNQAECYYFLQDQENFKKCLTDIDNALPELDTTELSSTLHFLSLLGKDLHDINLEKKFLTKLINLPTSNNYTKYAIDRTNELSLNKQEDVETTKDAIQNKLKHIFRQVEFNFSTFNFSYCIDIIKSVQPSIDMLPDKLSKINFYKPLGLSYLFMKEYTLAEQIFQQLLKEDEANYEYNLLLLVLGILTKNSELIEPNLSTLKVDSISAYNIKNLRLLLYFIINSEENVDIESLLNILTRSIDTDKAAFFRSLAVALSDYGFLTEAKKYLEMALLETKGRLSKSAIYCDIANLLVKQQLILDSISMYNNSIEINENDSRVYMNKAIAHSYLYEYELALENITQALNFWDTINPHEREFYLYIKSLIQESIQLVQVINGIKNNKIQKFVREYENEYLQYMFCDSTWYGNITKIFLQYLIIFQNKFDKEIAEPFFKYYNERYANLTFGVNWKSQELALKKYVESRGINKISLSEFRILLKNYQQPSEKKVPKFDEFVHKFLKNINFTQLLVSCEYLSPIIVNIVTNSPYESNKIQSFHRILIEEIKQITDIFALNT